jgi:hypothetical protein
MSDTLYYEDVASDLAPVIATNYSDAHDSFGRVIMICWDDAGRVDSAYPRDDLNEESRR